MSTDETRRVLEEVLNERVRQDAKWGRQDHDPPTWLMILGEEVGDNRLRPLVGLIDVAPVPAALRRLCEWTADYYLSPLAISNFPISGTSSFHAASRRNLPRKFEGEKLFGRGSR